MGDKTTPRTVIGPDIRIVGELHAAEDLVVHGRLEGTLRVDAVLFVERDGFVEGNATVRHAVVAGSFQGSLDASEALEVADSGKVQGEVSAPRMIVADGAVLNARIRMTAGAAATADATAATAAQPAGRTARSSYTYSVPVPRRTPAAGDAAATEEEDEVVEAGAAPRARKGAKKQP
ncbi:MAG: polymer-forming cytoskeletal protein [Deltaproteobacteria bacterium]|nr:polymer-forming cytoskeletal protein [Deltaproteobacteria bacterium]